MPSLVPLPEFKCLNPRDRLWEIKANSFFNLYIKRKCVYNNSCSLKSDWSNLNRNLGRNWDKLQTPVEGVKPITETEWSGDIWARWPGWLKLLAKLAKHRGKYIWSRDKRGIVEWEETGQTALPVGSELGEW